MMKLLERDSCLHDLREALQDVVGGEGRVALVSGEAGIGKTSLLRRFVREHAGAVPVLWGVCDALFTPRPLGPLHDMAAQLQGNVLALLSANAGRSAIFSAVLDALQSHPSIAVFEDAHWADEVTLDLLRYLGRRITHIPALVVLTYRDDELGPHHPLRSVLGDFASSVAVRRIPLQPLSERAVRLLVGKRVLDASALHRRTAGNPFYITEVLSSVEDALPSTVRDAVLARAACLSPPALDALQTAAVIGTRIETWLLMELTGSNAQAADECLSAGMLVVQDEHLAFRHEIARQTVLASISPPRRVVLHRQTLKALQASSRGRTDVTRLAHHAEAAGDRDAVLIFAPAAARKAGDSGAHSEAAALYRLAIEYADDAPLERRAMLLEAYARHSTRIDQRAQAVEACQQAIRLWHEAGNPLKEGENYAYLVILLIAMGQNPAAAEAAQAAIALFKAQPSVRHLALGYERQAVLHDFDSDYQQAIACCEKIVALPGLDRQSYEWRRTCMRLAAVRMFLDYERGCSELEHLLAQVLLAAQHDPQQEVEAANIYHQLGARSTMLFRFRRADRYLNEGLSYIVERDLYSLRTMMMAAQALTNVYLGQWDAADHLLHEALRPKGASSRSPMIGLEAHIRLAVRRGDQIASSVMDEALAQTTATGNIQRIGPIHAARAEAAWLRGDRERTLAEACAVYDQAECKHLGWIVGELAFWRWRAGDIVTVCDCIATPFALQIAGDWRAAAAEWQRLECPYEQARALADGDFEAQSEALDIFERLGARPAADNLRRTMRARGMSHIPRGPRPATRAHPFGLTARELEILALLAEDLTNVEMAERLHLAPKTVGHHVSAVLAKLKVHSRRAAVELAYAQQLMSVTADEIT